MVTRRSQTSLVQEQPVRFYKFIALTFLVLTIVLLAIIVFMSAKRADITISTKAAPIDVTSDLIFGGQDAHGLDYIMATTTFRDSRSFMPSGTETRVGTATGVVTLHNETNSPQPLVATTRLLDGDILFRLEEGVTVPANGTLENVAVYADKEGAAYDIGPTTFTIPGLNEAKQAVIYATSESSMKGGESEYGVISEEDYAQAETSMRAYIEKAAAEELQDTHEGKEAVFHVLDLIVQSDAEIGDEVDEFTFNGTAVVLGIYYDPTQVKEWAVAQLDKRSLESSDAIRPSEGETTVSFVDYDAAEGLATLRVFQDGIVTLSPESKQIEKSVFFGKTKNEVRRYLLSLDHVHKVDIDMTPAWIETIPSIHDHVTVIVKEVE